MSDGTNDFNIANQVSELLKDLPKDRQQRILRWVAESLGVPSGAIASSAVTVPDTGRYASAPQTTGRAIDIRSFVTAKNPRSDMQFAAVVAYYYRFEASPDKQLESISAEVLQDAARLVNRHRLSRPRQTLINARAQGYLDQVDRGQYRINSVGENLVAMTLPGTEAPVAPSSRVARGRTRKTVRHTAKPKGNEGRRTKKV